MDKSLLKDVKSIEDCIDGIEYAIVDLETELVFIKRYLVNLKTVIDNGQRRNE